VVESFPAHRPHPVRVSRSPYSGPSAQQVSEFGRISHGFHLIPGFAEGIFEAYAAASGALQSRFQAARLRYPSSQRCGHVRIVSDRSDDPSAQPTFVRRTRRSSTAADVESAHSTVVNRLTPAGAAWVTANRAGS
jgi:hypothetical protein